MTIPEFSSMMASVFDACVLFLNLFYKHRHSSDFPYIFCEMSDADPLP